MDTELRPGGEPSPREAKKRYDSYSKKEQLAVLVLQTLLGLKRQLSMDTAISDQLKQALEDRITVSQGFLQDIISNTEAPSQAFERNGNMGELARQMSNAQKDGSPHQEGEPDLSDYARHEQEAILILYELIVLQEKLLQSPNESTKRLVELLETDYLPNIESMLKPMLRDTTSIPNPASRSDIYQTAVAISKNKET